MTKSFLKLFFGLYFGEIILELAATWVSQKTDWHLLRGFLHILVHFCSYSMVIFDRSYPFYAQGPIAFGVILTVANVLVQTTFILLIAKQKQAAQKV